MGRIIELVKPIVPYLPEIQAPSALEKQRMTLSTKLMWTLGALLVYLICSQVPLYGINATGGNDAFYIMRMILASNKGTLMELGISPIITSGMVLQLLVGAKIIEIDLGLPSDRALYSAAQKLVGILITIGTAFAYVLSGSYGPLSQLGLTTAFLLIAQLFVSGMIVLMLDDLLSKGYGLGGGINVFIVTNICEGILWACFSPITYNSGGTMQFEGAIIAFFHLLLTVPNKFQALNLAFFREGLPNLVNIAATVLVFLIVIYIQGMKYEVPLQYANVKGAPVQSYPIKLFYTSNMPIILLSSVIGQVYFFSQVLYTRYGSNPLISLLGVWEIDPTTGRNRPTWGLSYLLSPPAGITELFARPIHSAFYIAFMLVTCGLFARMWVYISGASAADVYKQLNSGPQKVILKGSQAGRGNRLKAELDRLIPTAAMVGGMCIALLSISADILGAIGSGTGILMAVTIIYDLYEKVARDGGLQAALKELQGKN